MCVMFLILYHCHDFIRLLMVLYDVYLFYMVLQGLFNESWQACQHVFSEICLHGFRTTNPYLIISSISRIGQDGIQILFCRRGCVAQARRLVSIWRKPPRRGRVVSPNPPLVVVCGRLLPIAVPAKTYNRLHKYLVNKNH